MLNLRFLSCTRFRWSSVTVRLPVLPTAVVRIEIVSESDDENEMVRPEALP